jgi:hypothetical protein
VSGRLKVAPEHTSDEVLDVMRKPSFSYFHRFKAKFDAAKKRLGKAQLQIIPYFISSHPGSRPEDMAALAVETKALGFKLEQVQDFTPTPMTVATEIYATGVHPYDRQPVCVARTPEEKQEQRSFFFWYKPEMKAALRASMQRLGLGDMARRLLDGKKTTRDVTPPPHITPCGMNAADMQPGTRSSFAKASAVAKAMADKTEDRLAAATKGAPHPSRPHAGPRQKKPVGDLDKLLRDSGVNLPEKRNRR